MSLSFDVTKHTLQSAKRGLRVVPLQSNQNNIKERVSTDTNQKRIKKVTTVTTSRLAGQRIINKNTQTTTTDTNTHGIVELGQAEQRSVAFLQENQRAQRKNNSGNLSLRASHQSLPRHGDTHSSKLHTNRGIRKRNSRLSKYQPEKQCKELETIQEKRLVGTLASKFEDINNSSFREIDCAEKGKGTVSAAREYTNTADSNIEEKRNIQILNDDMFGQTLMKHKKDSFRSNVTETPHGNIHQNQKQPAVTFEYNYDSRETPSNITDSKFNKKFEGEDCYLSEPLFSIANNLQNKPEYQQSKNLTSSSEPSHMKTYTFSIPRSTLFQVSSKQLRSILSSSPQDLSNEATLEQTISKTLNISKLAQNADSEYGATGGHDVSGNFTPTCTSSESREDKDQNEGAFNTSLESLSNNRPPGGLDYSKIWGSVLKDVQVKPSRKVTCYRDYLDL